MDEDNYIQMQLKLSSAGLFYSLLPEEFVTLRYVCMGVTCLIAGGVYWQYAPLSYNIIALLVLAVFLGYAYPDIWLKDRIKARHIKIEREFPFLLDLLILSMKAGLNYSNALSQSIDSLKSGPIKEDFGRMQRELKAGKPRKDALVEMAERMDSPAIHNFVSSLNQAEETGGEMVVVLQGQAEHRRSERFQAAEEMAGKAPVKMLVPMMVFLFPLIFMLVGWVIMVGMAEADVLSPSLMRLMGY